MVHHSINTIAKGYINAGMPILEEDSHRSISPYEFLPSWFFYTPVVIQSFFLGLKHFDFALPLIANPSIKLSGMVGESKHDILTLAGPVAEKWISPFITITTTADAIQQQTQNAIDEMNQHQLFFPVVAKPDLGCRGVGVKLLQSQEQLTDYFNSFPINARFLIQEKAPYSAEAGIFYVRYPNEKKGTIISITLKYSPMVVGDGLSTLEQLIKNDSRAGQLAHLYLPRHKSMLNTILEKDTEFQLAFAGSHSRGSIFRDGNKYITDKLAQRLDGIFDDLEGFHYGRLDVKFKDINALMNGDDFTILEINGASSEAAHIWDRNTPLKTIFSTLLLQYKILFEIGALQKKQGHHSPKIKELLAAWKEEKQLTLQYPPTD